MIDTICGDHGNQETSIKLYQNTPMGNSVFGSGSGGHLNIFRFINLPQPKDLRSHCHRWRTNWNSSISALEARKVVRPNQRDSGLRIKWICTKRDYLQPAANAYSVTTIPTRKKFCYTRF